MRDAPIIPMGDDPGSQPAARVASARPWQSGAGLSSVVARTLAQLARSIADHAERFLATAGFDRAPWLAVLFMGGIMAWFALPGQDYWLAAMAAAGGLAATVSILWPDTKGAFDERVNLRSALIAGGLVFALGIAVIWARSEIVGAEAIERPGVALLQGHVLEREDQPADGRIRLTLAVRDAASLQAYKVRINVPFDALAGQSAGPALAEGAVVRLRARLMPPASPMLPGAYNFARAAWFKGLAATGSAIGPVELVRPATQQGGLADIQRALSAHVRTRVEGSAGTIAAAFASGDRGSIARADEEAMRDSGLTHLLSISGLHVSAVIAAAYLAVLKLLALSPALALRVRLPVVAAAGGALAGIGYTLLTGAEVPTVRSCVAAMLVLIALVLGRDALSVRMVAVAAGFVLLLWPESAIGPSFQMSFSAVLAIIALSTSTPVRAFLAAREEPWWARIGRRVVMLFVTGMVIELALMPVVLFHFHRAGLYGALANVIAIPLVTFIAMPLIALGLLFDLVGAGGPFWWLVQYSLDLLLGIAHFTASQPGAVKLMPQIGGTAIALFAGGGLWLALWTGRARVLGLLPIAAASVLTILTPVPDILVSSDGRQVGITISGAEGDRRLLSLRDSRSNYARDNLIELAGVKGNPVPLAEWPDARCSDAFCTLVIKRGGRDWAILMARSRARVEERALASACTRADIVIAERYLPRSCRPRWLKADRRLLSETGGLSINLDRQTFDTVAEREGQHGWWRGGG
ncbi:ComEC/Rec2 family competence protein [Erythrobacter sp. NFXS35]|uniref:ComEC/Rec2 family competence protein n=1 Tax=Erythrobacter sp. NFXS35 TaxID=2818436 RepID=UPI0032DF4B73